MKKETIPRYQNDGAFNIAFFHGDSVVIELLGKGFDGGQLTREKAVHERYTIPWNEVLFMRDKYDLQKSREVSKFVVPDEEYQRTRKERVAWLKSIESDKEAIEESNKKDKATIPSQLYYNLPGSAQVVVAFGDKCHASANITIAQYGIAVPIAKSLLLNKKAISYPLNNNETPTFSNNYHLHRMHSTLCACTRTQVHCHNQFGPSTRLE